MAITFVSASSYNNSSDNTHDVGEPAGAQEGDVIIVSASIDNSGGAWTDPADFTELDTHEDGGAGSDVYSCYIGYKVRGADAGSGYTFANAAVAAQFRIQAVAFRGVDPATPLDVVFSAGSHQVNYNNDVTSAAAAITTVQNGAWVVLLQHWSGGIVGLTLGAPSGYTSRSEVLQPSRTGFIVSKEVAIAGTETPGVWTTTGNPGVNDSSNWTLAIRPAATGHPALSRYRGTPHMNTISSRFGRGW